MKKLQDYKFWFIVGSQFLYGPEALKAVEEDAKNGRRFKCFWQTSCKN